MGTNSRTHRWLDFKGGLAITHTDNTPDTGHLCTPASGPSRPGRLCFLPEELNEGSQKDTRMSQEVLCLCYFTSVL